jgi:hypothetical protein
LLIFVIETLIFYRREYRERREKRWREVLTSYFFLLTSNLLLMAAINYQLSTFPSSFFNNKGKAFTTGIIE